MSEEKPRRPPTKWGVQQADFFDALRQQPVRVTLLNEKTYRGTLVGIDQFDIFIRHAKSGATLMIPKHAILMVAPVTDEQ